MALLWLLNISVIEHCDAKQHAARAEMFTSNVHSIDVEEQDCPSIQNSGSNASIVTDAGVSVMIDNLQNIDNHMDDDDHHHHHLLNVDNLSDLDDLQQSKPEHQHCGIMSNKDHDDSADETDNNNNNNYKLL